MSSDISKQKKKGGLDLYIIRHGEKTKDDLRLTKRGREQSKLVAKRLKQLGIKKIYSSNLPRCLETAEYIKKSTKSKIESVRELREVREFPKMKDPRFKKDFRRVKKFYNRVRKMKGKILLVGSGNVNRIILSLALNIDPKKARFLQIPSGLAHMEEAEDGKFIVSSVNDVSHLPERLKVRQGY